MNVLVAYASRHGSTAGIAEQIAAGLREAGLSAEARPVAQGDDVDAFDAFVIGSAAYMFHWLKDATRFVKRHRPVLEGRPVWLFSSGPLGTDRIDEQGRRRPESSPADRHRLLDWPVKRSTGYVAMATIVWRGSPASRCVPLPEREG